VADIRSLKTKAKVSQHAIDEAEKLLARCKSGEVDGFACAALGSKKATWVLAGSSQLTNVLGVITFIQHKLIKDIEFIEEYSDLQE